MKRQSTAKHRKTIFTFHLDPDDSNHLLWLASTIRQLTDRQLKWLKAEVNSEYNQREDKRKADPSVENLKKLFRL